MFFLRKTSTIHIELLFRNAPVKSSELNFLWFGLPAPLLIDVRIEQCSADDHWGVQVAEGPNIEKLRDFLAGLKMSSKPLKTRSTTTRDRNLQFRGNFSTGFFFGIFSRGFSPGLLCTLVRKWPQNVEKIARIPGGEKRRILSRLWLSWFFRSRATQQAPSFWGILKVEIDEIFKRA